MGEAGVTRSNGTASAFSFYKFGDGVPNAKDLTSRLRDIVRKRRRASLQDLYH